MVHPAENTTTAAAELTAAEKEGKSSIQNYKKYVCVCMYAASKAVM